MLRTTIFASSLGVAACAGPQELCQPGVDGRARCPSEDVVCLGDGDVSVMIDSPAMGPPITTDLTLTGTAEHSEGMTIRNLYILGIPAENLGFNFDAWRVTIPFVTLMAHAKTLPTAEGFKVELTATTRESCDGEIVSATAEGSVFIEPQVRLGTLHAQVTYPGVEPAPEYLGSTPNATATLTLSSIPPVPGAKVQVDAMGVLLGGVPDRTTLRLDSDGVASLELRGTAPGRATITARAGEDLVGAVLVVGGRPVLAPPAATLTANSALAVHGRVEGDVAASVTCRATSTESATVESALGPLTTPEGVTFDLGSGSGIDFVVTTSENVEPGVVIINCTEVAYAQVGTPLIVTIAE